MARRHNLTDKQIGALPRKAKRYILPDPEQRGLYLRVPPAGPITFTAVARGPYSKQIWTTLGDNRRSKNRRSAFPGPANHTPN